MKNRLWAMIQEQREFFSDCRDEIALRNLFLMRTICIVCGIIYVLYTLVTLLFFPEMMISLLYGLIVPLFLLFLWYDHVAVKNGEFRRKTSMWFLLLFYFILTSYVILLSVFPHPDIPSVYFPLFLVLAPVLFILPMGWHFLVCLVGLVAFFILVLLYKDPVCWNHELFEAVTAAVFSCVSNLLTTQFRFQTETLKKKYYNLSRLDALTGILNKETGLNALREYLEVRSTEESCALFFLDVDHFKSVNDTYGHAMGDVVLAGEGELLRALFSESDVLCRYGGDEFLLVKKDVGDLRNATVFAEQIMQRTASLGTSKGIPLSCSIGICYSKGKATAERLIQCADAALYDSKEAGRNRYTVRLL